MHSDDRIDQMIESGLRSYADPPAIPETRLAVAQVMARVTDEQPPRLRRWQWAAPVAACLVVVFALGLVWMLHAPRAPQIALVPPSPPVASVPSSSGSTSAPVQVHPRRVNRTVARAAKEQPLPKLDVFPTPEPLSPEEQALVAFAARTPRSVQQQVIAAEQHVADPINIAELTIRPLGVHDQQKSQKERETP
jgi:hypothetical protein